MWCLHMYIYRLQNSSLDNDIAWCCSVVTSLAFLLVLFQSLDWLIYHFDSVGPRPSVKSGYKRSSSYFYVKTQRKQLKFGQMKFWLNENQGTGDRRAEGRPHLIKLQLLLCIWPKCALYFKVRAVDYIDIMYCYNRDNF